MKAPLLSLLLVLLLLWGGRAGAQSKVLYEQTRLESVSISSFTDTDLGNLARELGYDNHNRSGKLVLPVEFEQREKITREGTQLVLYAAVQNVRVREQVLYRDFDFADVLTPSSLKAKVQLLGREDKVLQTFEITGKALREDGATVLVQTSVQDTSAFQGYKLRVVEKKLSFSGENYSALRNRLALLKQYQEADIRLAQFTRDLQTINPNDLEYLPAHKDRLQKLERELDHLVDSRMERELGLNRRDPLQLRRRVKELGHAMKERHVALDQMWVRLPEIYYNRGLELALNGNSRAGRDFFERALQANPAFAPAHLQLARLDYRAGYLKEASQRIRELLNRLQVDPETYRFGQELALDIQNEYVRNGERLNNQGKYQQALEQFEEARDFCRGISSLRCRPELWEEGIVFAKNGLYDNLLQSGKQALNQKNLVQAEKLAKEAQQYARNNKTAIDSDAAASALLRDVQQQMYLGHMTKGRQALQTKQYAVALEAFEKGKTLASDYSLTPQPDADKLIRQAARPVIMEKITQGQLQASANKLPQARTIASEVTNLQIRYGLVNDKELDGKFRALSQGIFSQECANAQATYDQHLQRAMQYSQERKFALAAAELDKAVAAAQQNGGCAISSATAQTELDRIDAPAFYQEQLQKASQLISQNKVAEAVTVYQEAGRQFETDRVGAFGLVHEALLPYAQRQENKAFMAEVARFSSANGDAAGAIELVKKLVALKYTKYNLNQLQEQVGQHLATRDAQANPKADYKQLANTYTNGSKDLKKLNKAYQKQFKKLT
ncbi:tetratricopeptide repeat protein [Rufibacter immobilis]|uniref:tetratricopeptide repeat protein n=1 Tax=Rufibacter immobilis TaxID=1348778 RepID=UPI0035EF5E5C